MLRGTCENPTRKAQRAPENGPVMVQVALAHLFLKPLSFALSGLHGLVCSLERVLSRLLTHPGVGCSLLREIGAFLSRTYMLCRLHGSKGIDWC